MSASNHKALQTLVHNRLAAPVSRQVEAIGGTAMAQAAKTAGKPIDEAVAALLAYGSCLRDVSPEEGLADFYVLMADGIPVSTNPFSRLGCKLFAPNVYYAECEHEGKLLRAKYAVLPLAQFEQRVSRATRNPYFWARFAQPSALIHAQNAETRARVENAVQVAAETMLHNALPLCAPSDDVLDIWARAMTATYGTELRSEGTDRARHIIETDPNWYKQTAYAVLGGHVEEVVAKQSDRAWAKERARWKHRRWKGKLLSVARLLKASFTFQGGADYLAWKIERHSGVPVKLNRWQRKHPILASIWLYPKLKLKGAFR